jgi:aminocarboxymuconate-semialdehyde decarboxylase
MPNRRDFVKTAAGAAAGTLAFGHGFLSAQAPAARRQISIGGKRVRVIDIHCHCVIPEAAEVVKGTPFAQNGPGAGGTIGPERLVLMDKTGVDVQSLSINGYWWFAVMDRDLAARVVKVQNEGLAKIVAANPTRFSAMASVALQYPDLAAQQLEEAKRLGLRGVSIGGHCNGEDLSNPKYDPFWAKAAELGALVFMHPGGSENILKEGALRGRGDLGNIMGNPLETTYFLSRLIFDGTFDKFPALKVAAAHAGGYLPSYFGRTEVACDVRGNANCANKRRPKEILRSQIVTDTMVFSDEGLRHLVNEMGVNQVVYGTDVPFNWPVTVDLVLNATWLSNAEKEAILGGNLARLLQLTS